MACRARGRVRAAGVPAGCTHSWRRQGHHAHTTSRVMTAMWLIVARALAQPRPWWPRRRTGRAVCSGSMGPLLVVVTRRWRAAPADPVRIPSKWQCGGAGVAVGQHRRHGRCSGVHVHPAAGCAAPAPRHAGPSTTPTTICMQVAATVVQWSSTQGPVLVPSGACISRGSQGSAVPSASAGADHEAPVAVVAVVTVVASCPAPKCRRRGPRWRWCPRESRDPPSPVSITEC